MLYQTEFILYCNILIFIIKIFRPRYFYQDEFRALTASRCTFFYRLLMLAGQMSRAMCWFQIRSAVLTLIFWGCRTGVLCFF